MNGFTRVKEINVFELFYQQDRAVSQNRQMYDGTQV
jgi:hypothetical protein